MSGSEFNPTLSSTSKFPLPLAVKLPVDVLFVKYLNIIFLIDLNLLNSHLLLVFIR